MDKPGPDEQASRELQCVNCGSAVRQNDRFCSQCGRRDPLNADQDLNAPTLIQSGEGGIGPGSLASIDLSISGTYIKDGDPSGGAAGKYAYAKRYSTADLQRILQPGAVFGRRYRIQRFLGAGAMGYVCSAVDESIDELIALKVLSAPIQEDPEAFERFKVELKLARRIRHRNVVQSFDLGFAEGYPFISMEYIDADNVMKHLQRSSFDEDAALTVMRQVLRGLRAAHELGIVHRDIKPENVLLNKDKLAFITDFGIATSPALMKRRELAGTPDYMAPEQLRFEDITPAADIYSAGVMLYRMLAGHLPYVATTMKEIVDAHLHQTPLAIPGHLAVSGETRELIDWMLQKSAQARPQSSLPVLEQIDGILSSRTRSWSASRRATVLVVEEDQETIDLLRTVLEADGYRVVVAPNAREGVNIAFEQTPALIFLDAKIRGGFQVAADDDETSLVADGIGFVRILSGDEKLKKVPIVLLTDKTLPQLDRSFGGPGVADVMIKPLMRDDVIEAAKFAKV
jgi:CheY-like chemotaxis protein